MQFYTGSCLRARGLYPLISASDEPTPGRSFHFISCRYLSAWGLYPLPRRSSVPTPRDAFSAAAWVLGACTPFRERNLYRFGGTLIQSHSLSLLEREGPIRPSTRVVCTDPRDARSAFAACRCLSARGQ